MRISVRFDDGKTVLSKVLETPEEEVLELVQNFSENEATMLSFPTDEGIVFFSDSFTGCA